MPDLRIGEIVKRYATIGLACGVACWGLILATAHAGEATASNLAITQAWSRAMPGGDKWVVRMDAPQSGRWSLDLGIRLSATDAVNIEAPILIR